MSAFKRIYVQNTGTAFEDNSSDLTTVPSKTVQLVNAGDTDPGGSDPAGADPGQTIDTSADVGAGLDISDYDAVRLLFRDADILDGLIDQSPVIPVSELSVSDLAYAAPAIQQTDVEVPSGPSGGAFWTLKITNLESGNQPFQRRSFEVEVGDNESASDIAQKFADAINEAEDSINDWEGASVTANANSAVVEITAKEAGDIFDVATRNFDEVSNSTVTQPTPGVGTPDQVARREADDDGTLGRYVESTNLLGSIEGPATYTDPAGQYDLLTFTFDGDSEKAVNKSIARQTYMVALESAVVANATTGGNSTNDYIDFLSPVIDASG